MKRLFICLNLILAAIIIVSPAFVFADSGKKATPAAAVIDTSEHRVSDNMVIQATGRTQVSASGDRLYEYKARIDSAPSYVDGADIDTTWHSRSDTKWTAGTNLFMATVSGGMVRVGYYNHDMLWSPQVFVGGKEYNAPASAELLPVDPVNSNYQNNVLSWDYGVCERQLRLIEGEIIETYIFDKDPGADIQIKSNVVKDNEFVYDMPVSAYDAAGNSIPISANKTVKAADLKTAVYPVTVDPTDSFTTSSSDGYITGFCMCYWPDPWVAATGSVTDTLTQINLGMVYTSWPTVYRGYLYFDTSDIPDLANISAVNISLYGYTDLSSVDFNISVTNGQPTYPHDPLATGDYDKSLYSGIGNPGFNTAGFTTAGYNKIALNSTGISWINLAGTTRLCLRSSLDIAGTTPIGTSQYISVYSCEKGDGYRPYLEITYLANTVPTLTTSAASYVAKTTARLNGLVVSDGGEDANVSFNYQPWYSAGWQDCIEFTINASYVDADLTNFPVLVTGTQLNTTDPDFWTTVNSTGSDILFTNSAGTKLNRELVSIDVTNKSMECYVNVTSVDDTTNTKIYMYYNSVNISLYNESNSTATWDTNYVAVFHLNDNPNTSTVQDSTVNNVDGIKKGANEPIESTGLIAGGLGKCQLWDGADDYIEVPHNANQVLSTGGSLEAVINAKSIGEGSAGRIMDKYATSVNGLSFLLLSTTVLSMTMNATITSTANGAYTFNSTYNVVSTFNSTGYTNMYSNSVNKYSAQGGNPLNISYTGNMRIGQRSGATDRTFDGYIDEFRMSNTNRSAGWVDATYHTLMTPTSFAPVTDVFTSTAAQTKTTGESYYQDITGLSGGTLYAYKTEGVNSYGSSWGSWVQFTTSVTCAAPTNMSAYPNATAVELVWLKGSGSTSTLIKYKEGSYPSSTTDGELVYNGSSSSYIQTGLTPGTNYYYRAWADDGTGTYSASYASSLVTTFAGEVNPDVTPESPTAPSGWFGAPHYENMANMPGYDINNALADSISMPRNTFWMGWAIFHVILVGIVLFFVTKKNPLIAILGSAVVMAYFGTAGLISWWYVGIYLIAAIAFSYKAVVR